jgi:hypothetical protein
VTIPFYLLWGQTPISIVVELLCFYIALKLFNVAYILYNNAPTKATIPITYNIVITSPPILLFFSNPFYLK